MEVVETVSMEYNVLIVDDSKLIVDRLTSLLKELDCISYIGSANSFAEASSLMEMNAYNLAILDINLPGKNGIELLTHIKEFHPGIKTIMLTNQTESYYRELCNKIGSDDYVDKTNDFERIPDLINTYYSSYVNK